MSNPGGPIILPLTTYVEQSLTSMLQTSTSDDAFTTAFDAFFSKEMKDITFNGKKLTRDKYMAQMKAASNARNTVTFGGIVNMLTTTTDTTAIVRYSIFFGES